MEEDEQPLLQKLDPTPEANIFIRFVKPCVAEFLTTAIFVFAGTLSVQTGNGLLVAFVHGITIALMVFCFGHISGAHINPAVTLTVLIGSSLRYITAFLYVICQLIGSMVGAALTRAVLSFPMDPHTNETVYMSIAGGTHHIHPGMSEFQGVLLEVFMTFMVCQTVLMMAVDRQSPFAPLTIGLTVFVDIAFGGNLTGGSMNPARSFGPAVVISSLSLEHWTYHYVYWVGPFSGAVLAALLYRFFLASGRYQVIRALRLPSETTLDIFDG